MIKAYQSGESNLIRLFGLSCNPQCNFASVRASSFTPFNRMSSFHFMPEIYSRFSKCTCKMMSPPRFSICSLNPGSWNIYVLWLTPWTFRSLNMPFIQMNVPIHAGPVAYTRLPVNIMRSRQRGMSKELVSSHLFTLRLSISCGVTDLA